MTGRTVEERMTALEEEAAELKELLRQLLQVAEANTAT